MEVQTIESFLSYYENTREITMRIIEKIPHDKVDWAYMPGKFTIGGLIRHIGAIERNVFAELAIGNQSKYVGCGKELGSNYEEIVDYLTEMHAQSVMIFKTLTDADLGKTINAIGGIKTTLSAFLRALIIHEVHHRGALCIYLNLLGVTTPSVLGITEEQVRLFSNPA